MSDEKTVVGVIGLGLLGSAICERLIASGFCVVGFDIAEGQRRKLDEIGGQSVARASDVVDRCPVVVLSLPTSEIVLSVIEQISVKIRRETIVIDTTTGNPNQIASAAEQLAKRNTKYLEANVAGSSKQLCGGGATLFLGGDEATIQEAEAVLSALATKRLHLGPVGSASKFKLVHNVVLGLHRAVLAEGICFGEALGFSSEQTLEILKQTPAASTVMDTKGDKMVARDYEPQARLSQHLKDVRLILDQAKQSGIAMPLSDVHRQLLQHAESLGFGDADNSAIIEAYRTDNS